MKEKEILENGEDPQNSRDTETLTCGRFQTKTLVSVVVVAIVFSSVFGALFGFMSAGVASFFSASIGEKMHQIFPNIKVRSIESNSSSKQQIIVEDSAVIDVVKKSSPAVVSIMISKDVSTTQNQSDNLGGLLNPFSPNPFDGGGSSSGSSQIDGQTTQKEVIGSASGFLITTDGLVLTNKHVVSDSQAQYTVITNDDKEYPTTVLAQDPVRDVALIKIDGTPPAGGFPTLPLGDSDAISVGQTVVAIGDSLGELSNSVSRGIISGLKRNVSADSGQGDTERLTDIIQTDAAINPGNSGGPLLDVNGNVIGLNVAAAQGANNIGFALPINQVKRIIDQVERGVQISVPYLGVRYVVIDSIVQQEANLPFDYGVLVTRGDTVTDLAVLPGSPADIAGIVENDIILEINGEKITKDDQLTDIIAKYKVGDQLTLKVWHKGQTKDVQVTLQEVKQ